MKILQLCHKPPLPPIDGGCIAMHNITQGLLNSNQEVRVVAVETQKHPVQLKAFPVDYLQKTRFESVFMDTTPRFMDGVRSIFKRHSFHIERFNSRDMAAKLEAILTHEKYDIVHLESIYVSPYINVIRKYSKARIVMRMHNIEHKIWERLADNESNLIKKILYNANRRQLERTEKTILKRVDGYMTISDPDYQYFSKTAPEIPGIIIPFGIDMDNYVLEDEYIPSDKPSLCHIGSMNWSPNMEGIEWFLDEVWPMIHAAHPELQFTVAGHGTPDSLYLRKDPNVEFVGSVPDANEFMLDHDMMIVPLLSGSGVRVKIVEAMALGRVVITTSVGAEGLAVENGKHLFIADTPEEFVSVLDKCIQTPDLCAIISENARDFIAMHHNNELITETILDFYQQIIEK
ncbi:MAG: glycosyltransferase family 4 protein [Bacteroidales bacterium]|nr:glycosyltransferase family 4 protein [Bacteroidales bacterium]